MVLELALIWYLSRVPHRHPFPTVVFVDFWTYFLTPLEFLFQMVILAFESSVQNYQTSSA